MTVSAVSTQASSLPPPSSCALPGYASEIVSLSNIGTVCLEKKIASNLLVLIYRSMLLYYIRHGNDYIKILVSSVSLLGAKLFTH